MAAMLENWRDSDVEELEDSIPQEEVEKALDQLAEEVVRDLQLVSRIIEMEDAETRYIAVEFCFQLLGEVADSALEQRGMVEKLTDKFARGLIG